MTETDRAWHRQPREHWRIVWLSIIVAMAAALRFWSLGYGVPYAVGVDEPEIMVRVLAIMRTGDYNPHFFHYPGLIFYLHLPVAIARFVVGAAAGEWRTLAAIETGDLYVWSRGLSAAFGVLTVVVVYRIGLRWGQRQALIASALMAVMPLHVRESHFVLADVPATFFVAVTWLLSLRAEEQGQYKPFVLAGAAAGLATAVKYHVGAFILLPLLTASTPGRPLSRTMTLTGAAAGFVVAFLAASPYTILDLSGFLNSFAGLLASFQPRTEPESGTVVYLKHLRLNLGWVLLVLTGSGLAMAAWRASVGPQRMRWLSMGALPCLFLVLIGGRQQIYARYLLPIVPFLCVLAAIAVASLEDWLGRFDLSRRTRTALVSAVTVAAFAAPTIASVRHIQFISTPTTLEEAYLWIEQNVSARTPLVVENYDLRLPAGRYEARHVVWLPSEPLEHYRESGVKYLIANSRSYGLFLEHPGTNPELASRYRTLFRQTREVKRFSPGRGRTGPEIRILEVLQ